MMLLGLLLNRKYTLNFYNETCLRQSHFLHKELLRYSKERKLL